VSLALTSNPNQGLERFQSNEAVLTAAPGSTSAISAGSLFIFDRNIDNAAERWDLTFPQLDLEQARHWWRCTGSPATGSQQEIFVQGDVAFRLRIDLMQAISTSCIHERTAPTFLSNGVGLC
jgi:hypothetical protein